MKVFVESTRFRGWGSSWVPTIDSRSAATRRCAVMLHILGFTFKIRQIGERCPFKGFGGEKISLRKEDIGVQLISSHIKKGGCVSFIRVYILELLLKSDCNTPPTYLINI